MILKYDRCLTHKPIKKESNLQNIFKVFEGHSDSESMVRENKKTI